MALYSTNGVLYPRGHSGAMSMVHCHSLACISVSYSITYMFCWQERGMKRRQRAAVLALVYCGRLSSVLDLLDFRISRILERSGYDSHTCDVDIRAFALGIHAGLYSRSAQSAGAERHQTSSHRRLDQPA
jgi:hypothetical protein